MPDLENIGVFKEGPEYENCSHGCVFWWPWVDNKQLHYPDCTPLKPRSEAERQQTRDQYKNERVKASLRASQKEYEQKNHLQRGKDSE